MFTSKKLDEFVSNGFNEKVKIKDLMGFLNVQDVRTAKKWCLKTGLMLFKLGKEFYVNLIDLELAIEKPFIEKLKMNYPDKWKQVYAAYKSKDYEILLSIMDESKSVAKGTFIAPGKSGDQFLKKVITKK